MSLQIIPFRSSNDTLFQHAREIRDVVFIQEQKVEVQDEFDEFEDVCLHFLMSFDGKAFGTARWRRVGDKVKLERFAVLKEYRGKKYGDQLLKAVTKSAASEKKTMYVHAQLKAIPFYARQGFKKVGGLFVECEIEHYKMVRK
ncbi:GNAT family N-acetyltransferase [Vicingaceae bacterium]|nr:GNAT family N-acetyltransferase [Vicingaceae bacterium]MDB9964382.1 GNAT family N-acetyltransferase [Vicingaceae bacterium]MDC1451532.1 GNAT family N-acetyltransferase [Vicingaceae bacterium]